MSGINVLWVAKYRQIRNGESHRHSFYQLICPLSGVCFLDTKVQIQQLECGKEIVLAKPGEYHAFHASEQPNHLPAPIAFDCKFTVDDTEMEAALANLPICFSIDHPTYVLKLIEQVLMEAHKNATLYQQTIDATISTLIIHLIRQFTSRNFEQPDSPQQDVFYIPNHEICIRGVNPRLLMEYIDQNIANTITLDQLSNYAHVNKTTLIHIFKEFFGMTPTRYIIHRRLSLARELLQQSTKNISEIADTVGFQSLQYFSKTFKEWEGISPMEFRACNADCYFTLPHSISCDPHSVTPKSSHSKSL